MLLALGLIETKGLIGAIEAADAMAKAANVQIIGKEKSSGALITIKIVGEVAAVKSAVDAAAVAVQRVGELVGAHVIPRPHEELKSFIEPAKKVKVASKLKTVPPKPKPPQRKVEVKESVAPVIKEEVAEKISHVAEEELPLEITKVEEKVQEKLVEEKVQKLKPQKGTSKIRGMDTLAKLRAEAKSELEQPVKEIKSKTSDVQLDEEIMTMNVHELRRLARSKSDFPIKGREISKANRKVLLEYLKQIM